MKYKGNDRWNRISKLFDRKNRFCMNIIFATEKTKLYITRIVKLMNAMEDYRQYRMFSCYGNTHLTVLRSSIYENAQRTVLDTLTRILREVFGDA